MVTYTKERIELVTQDKAKIVGSYYSAEGDKGVILLHQYRLSKDSFDKYAKELQKRGYPVLALDFRGHGESYGTVEGLTERDFSLMIEDVNSASDFLNNKEKEVLAVIGASIGANNAFRFSSVRRIPAVLLSPGLNYHEIDIKDITCSSPIFIIASKGDEYSANSSRNLYENNLFGPKKMIIVPGSSAHGVYMLDENPKLFEEIINFLKKMEEKD